jgi:solute carrier family 8 (sodium/calcium exchanger)
MQGQLEFGVGETEKSISVEIVDDNEWEPDEVFYVGLHAPFGNTTVQAGSNAIAEVTIYNDDDPGYFGFEHAEMAVQEEAEEVTIPVLRWDGSDGAVTLSWRTIDVDTPTDEHKAAGVATPGVDYVASEGKLEFAHGVTRGELKIPILNTHQATKSVTFGVTFSIDGNPTNGTKYGPTRQCIIAITHSESFSRVVAKIAAMVNADIDELDEGNLTWKEQIMAAISPDIDDTVEASSRSLYPYAMHVITMFWKVIFAVLVPPAHYFGGLPAFFIALALIGAITAVVGDLA